MCKLVQNDVNRFTDNNKWWWCEKYHFVTQNTVCGETKWNSDWENNVFLKVPNESFFTPKYFILFIPHSSSIKWQCRKKYNSGIRIWIIENEFFVKNLIKLYVTISFRCGVVYMRRKLKIYIVHTVVSYTQKKNCSKMESPYDYRPKITLKQEELHGDKSKTILLQCPCKK